MKSHKIKRVFGFRNITISLVIALIIGLLFGAVITVRGAGDYDYYIPVTIESDYVEGTTHVDFPVVIQETITELKTTANSGHVENTVGTGGVGGALTVPADFGVYSDDTCTTLLDYEWESYSATTGAITLWVEIPSLSGSVDTIVYLCYGDSALTTNQEDVTGTWNSGFAGVWHLAETTGTFKDSTSNTTHGSDYISDTEKTGVIGSGQGFDGTDDYIQLAESIGGPLDNLDSIHISGWFNPDVINDEMAIDRYMGSTNDLQLWFNSNVTWRSATQWTINKSLTANVWTFINANFDGTYVRLWTDDDAVTEAEETDRASSSNEDWWIGLDTDASSGGSKGNYYNGSMDEIRFSNINRSEDWVYTDFNMIDESLFLSVGTESTPTPPATATPTATATATATATPTATATATATPTATATATATPPAIVMGNASETVPSGLDDAIETALGNYRPDSELGLANPDLSNMWAITSYGESSVSDYYWVSVAGLIVEDTGNLDGWYLENSLWNGLAVAYDNGDTTYTAHLYGSVGYENMLATAGLSDISAPDVGGTGSSTYYFPFPPGYVAYYGTKGVHEAGHGYGGLGYRAVDFVGGTTYADNIFPNSVYVSQSGVVSFVCRDSVQTWVQIGNFLYGHLNDNETLDYEVYHSQGSYLGSLITDTHETKCGYTYQRPTSYHLHIGFLPSGNYFQWEDWTLDMTDEKFHRGASEISPGDYILAEWSSNIIVPTPGPTVTPGGPTVTPSPVIINPTDDGGGGGSFWDGILAGMSILVQERVDMLNDPDYVPPDLPDEITLPMMLMSGIRIIIRSVYVLLKSNFNLFITLAVFGIILVLEPIRFLRAIWMGIKNMIPFIG